MSSPIDSCLAAVARHELVGGWKQVEAEAMDSMASVALCPTVGIGGNCFLLGKNKLP